MFTRISKTMCHKQGSVTPFDGTKPPPVYVLFCENSRPYLRRWFEIKLRPMTLNSLS